MIIAKVCRQENLSNLFQSTQMSNTTHQALELKSSENCKLWQLNEKMIVLVKDSTFTVHAKSKKEKVEKLPATGS